MKATSQEKLALAIVVLSWFAGLFVIRATTNLYGISMLLSVIPVAVFVLPFFALGFHLHHKAQRRFDESISDKSVY